MDWVANLKLASPSVWVDRSLDFGTPSDPFSSMFLKDENILDTMMSEGEIWEDYHHRSHLPDYEENNLSEIYHEIHEIKSDMIQVLMENKIHQHEYFLQCQVWSKYRWKCFLQYLKIFT